MPIVNPLSLKFEDWAPDTSQPTQDIAAFDHKNAQDAEADVNTIIDANTRQLSQLNEVMVAQESAERIGQWMRDASCATMPAGAIALLAARSALNIAQRKLGCSFECLKMNRGLFLSENTYSQAYRIAHEEITMTGVIRAIVAAITALIQRFKYGSLQAIRYAQNLMRVWKSSFKQHTYPANEDELRKQAGPVKLSEEDARKLYASQDMYLFSVFKDAGSVAINFWDVIKWINSVITTSGMESDVAGSLARNMDFVHDKGLDWSDTDTIRKIDRHLGDTADDFRTNIYTWAKGFGEISEENKTFGLVPKYGATRKLCINLSGGNDGYSFYTKDVSKENFEAAPLLTEMPRLAVQDEHEVARLTQSLSYYCKNFEDSTLAAQKTLDELTALVTKHATKHHDSVVKSIGSAVQLMSTALSFNRAIHLHNLDVIAGLLAWAKASQRF